MRIQKPKPEIRKGFTLVELLVVITIIVILLALLMPALDKAIYQAELTVCAAHLDGAATGAVTYAMNHQRHYPDRQAIYLYNMPQALGWWPRPNLMRYKNEADDLSRLNGFIDLDLLLCPLNGTDRISLKQPLANTTTYSNYAIWWDWGYTGAGGGAKSSRIGQRFSWTQPTTGQRTTHNVLITDWDYTITTWNQRIHSSHPDRQQTASFVWSENGANALGGDETVTRSRWDGAKGVMDLNYAYQDGSVTRISEVTLNDPRTAHVPIETYFTDAADIHAQIAP